jgi:hypothetical protein
VPERDEALGDVLLLVECRNDYRDHINSCMVFDNIGY